MSADFTSSPEFCQKIAAEVRSASIEELPGWSSIVEYYQDKDIAFSFHGIDCDPISIAVHPDRTFDGRARVLMHYTAVFPDGFHTLGSQTFPGMVYGRIDPRGEIHIERFRFGKDGRIPPEGILG
ncbi:hypothetical protein KBI52_21030 [Microvirga sp. HBU67558]|nr:MULTISPECIES: hypothetical protein [unclassified Microvirga]MBQ0822674.1 hypothetical protein [Microvirga sp. HBU67558]